MTLNITIVTPEVVYQSADFRITDPKTKSVIEDKSPKSVGLQYGAWRGLVTYTGLGLWQRRATSEWVANWLTGKSKLSMDDVAEILRTDGAALVAAADAGKDGTPWRLTFTLAGFDGSVATAFVISNCQDPFVGREWPPASSMEIASRAVHRGQKPIVLITGATKAVVRGDRRALKRLADNHRGEAVRIRRAMEKANAKASTSRSHGYLISKDCVVVSLRNDGSGIRDLDSTGENPRRFPTLAMGFNLSQQLEDALKSEGVDPATVRLGQTTFAASPPAGVPPLTWHCDGFSVATPDGELGFELGELTADEFDLCTPQAMSNRGHIVGVGRVAPGQPEEIPWLHDDRKVVRLSYRGSALAVNDHGHVAGNAHHEQGGTRAVLWTGAELVEPPLRHGPDGVFTGTGSTVRSINNSTDMAGTVSSQTEEGRAPDTRLAVFRPKETPMVNMALAAEDGAAAVRISQAGVVLVRLQPAAFSPRTVLWNQGNDEVTYVGGENAVVYPISFTADGLVLGQQRDQRTQPVAAVCEPGGSWQQLGTKPGWAPVDMNDHGDVVGWAYVDRLQRPWLRLASGEIVWLPYVRDHNCAPRAINNQRRIIGTATADRCRHALVWEPLP